MEVGDGEAETRRGLEAAGGGVHSDGGRCEGVVGRKHESSPVLAVVVGSCWGAGYDIMPPFTFVRIAFAVGRQRKECTYSRMFDSEGWASMNGGGFSEMVLYSRVN